MRFGQQRRSCLGQRASEKTGNRPSDLKCEGRGKAWAVEQGGWTEEGGMLGVNRSQMHPRQECKA
jgi:hypothetical protein